MEDSLNIDEKFSDSWTTATALLAILSLLQFLAVLWIEDVLWKGVIRVTSFISFAAAVISGLKLIEGRHQIKLQVEDDGLAVIFYRKKEIVQGDQFELSNIDSLALTHLPPSVFTNRFFKHDYNVEIQLKDSDRPLNLFELDNRVISVTKKSAVKVIHFIKRYAPEVDINRKNL